MAKQVFRSKQEGDSAEELARVFTMHVARRVGQWLAHAEPGALQGGSGIMLHEIDPGEQPAAMTDEQQELFVVAVGCALSELVHLGPKLAFQVISAYSKLADELQTGNKGTEVN